MKIKTLETNLVYENAFVRVWDDDVEFPSGKRGTYFRTRWTAPYGVLAAPTDGQDVLLAQVHRYGAPAPSWEFPKGFGEAGGAPETCAARELREETGLTAQRLTPLFTAGLDFPEHVFAADVADLSEATTDYLEASEAMGGFKRVPIFGAAARVDFAALGVSDPLTMAAFYALRDWAAQDEVSVANP